MKQKSLLDIFKKQQDDLLSDYPTYKRYKYGIYVPMSTYLNNSTSALQILYEEIKRCNEGSYHKLRKTMRIS